MAVTEIRFLVRPGRFEPWEREALSYPLHPRGPSGAGCGGNWTGCTARTAATS